MAKLSIEFDPRAEKDVFAALSWYDQHGSKIGNGFIERLDEIIVSISEHPQLYPPLEGQTRRALMYQYPYAVYYQINESTIQIIAVLHTSRQPDYSKDR